MDVHVTTALFMVRARIKDVLSLCLVRRTLQALCRNGASGVADANVWLPCVKPGRICYNFMLTGIYIISVRTIYKRTFDTTIYKTS